MKIHVAWLPVVSVYFFCVGVVVSHGWAWSTLDGTALFTDGWFVIVARIVTILVPFAVAAIGIAKFCTDGVESAVRGR